MDGATVRLMKTTTTRTIMLMMIFTLAGPCTSLAEAQAPGISTGMPVTEMVRRAEAAVGNDTAAVTRLNDEISAYYSAIPDALIHAVTAAGAIDDDEIRLTVDELAGESAAAMAAGDLETAIEMADGALQFVLEVLGEEHWAFTAAMRDLGYLYRLAGDAESADAYYSQALAGATDLLGETHPQTLEIAGLMVELYGAAGAVEDAHALNEAVIAGYSESLGQYHELTLEAVLSSVTLLETAGEIDAATGLAEVVCSEFETSRGRYHPGTVNCLMYLGSLGLSAGDLVAAAGHYEESLARLGASLASIDQMALNAMNQLAEVHRQAGRYNQAADLLSGVIQLAAQIGQTDVSYRARSYLGRVLRDEGELAKAESMLQDVLDYGLANWQDQPLNVYGTMLELGTVFQGRGRLAEAEATFEEAWVNLSSLVGELNPSTLVALNNLGQVYEEAGLYDLAEPALKQVVDDMSESLGEDHPQTSRARSNLALLHESQGNFREAEPLYERSLELLSGRLGQDHSEVIAVRNNLAFLYMMMEQYEQAGQMFESVQEGWIRIFGQDHPSTLKATNNLGRVYMAMGDLPRAEQLVQSALALRGSVLGPEHIDTIRSMIDLGDIYRLQRRLAEADELLTRALALAEQVLSEQHPYTFEALRALARVKEARGMTQAAVDVRELGFNRRNVFLDRMLWVTGENAREGYVRLHREELNEYLALLTRIDPAVGGRLALDASLHRKGLLLKITSEIQQISRIALDPAMSAIAEQLEATRRELAAKTLSGPTVETQGRHAQVLYELEQEVNELQGELGRASVRYRSSIAQVSVDSLVAELADGAALVDYLTYEVDGVRRLLAGVARRQGDEVLFDLVTWDSLADVDQAVIEYRTFIQDDLADPDELLEVGQETHEIVWAPLADALGESEYVYLIPDGVLNILPFNAIVNEDEEYLIQTHDLHLLTSGRDLLPTEFELARGEYLIVAGPDYDSTEVVSEEALVQAQGRRSAAIKLGIRGVGGGLRGLSFAPLPGAAEEGRIITDQVEGSDEVGSMFFGVQAQEIVLATVPRPPEILHMATHGFFLEADDTLRERLLKAQRSVDVHIPPPGDNPLLRSGLAFAGINNNAQFLGDIDTENDGVLTALEVLGLNLSGTRLVVLSACETGLGEIHEGEGVYGLRRSFQEAGVAEVVSSLWEVSDAGTQALMTDFYERILDGTPAREALRETQLELIDSPLWGYPYVWSAFMIVGSYESAGVTIQ